MKPNKFIKELEFKELLTGEGFALDLGCGDGRDSLYLTEKGYRVIAVDKNEKNKEIFSSHTEINFINSDIADFNIEKNKYSLIIANNVLPFISDKEKVTKLISDMVGGLVSDGIVYLTLFGPNDEWVGKANMSFWNFYEGIDLLKTLPLSILNRSTEEGYGKTMKGESKYWHIHKFLYKKV